MSDKRNICLLVQQLTLEKDRMKYSKVIDMSNSIQTRLDNLYNCNTINSYPTCYVFKRLDRATSMQFNLYRKQRQQQRTNSLFIHKSQINNRTSDMSEDEDEILNVLPCTIHKAVRKNASVIRIEKTTTKTNHQHKPTFVHGLITPPESPFNQNVFDNQLSLPLLIHAHKVIILKPNFAYSSLIRRRTV
jgi:hypothetical protein